MMNNRAHLVLTKDKPRHIHDLDLLIPETAPMTEAQTEQVRKARKIWSTRNETAYSFLMEVCNAHPKAGTTAALYEGNTAKGLMQALEETKSSTALWTGADSTREGWTAIILI